jgi:hypothetical protein
MTTPRAVSLLSEEPGWGRALVSSLPRSLRRGDGADADIALIDGRDDWPTLAFSSLKQGCRHLLVIAPAPAEISAMKRLADDVEARGAACVLSESFASSPALADYRDWLGPEFGTITLESVGADAPETMALAQLRLLRALGAGVAAFGSVTQSQFACLIEADVSLGERRIHVRMSAAQSNAGPTRHLVSAYSSAASAQLEFTHGGDARPATASLSTVAGIQTLPSIHESAHRHQLRMLLEREFTDSAGALRAFADDAALALSLRLNP